MLELQTSGCYDLECHLKTTTNEEDYCGRFIMIQVGKTLFGRGHLVETKTSLKDIPPEKRPFTGIYIDFQGVIPVIQDFKHVQFEGKAWIQPYLGDFSSPSVRVTGAFHPGDETASMSFTSADIIAEMRLFNWFFVHDIVKNELWSDFLGYQITAAKPWCILLSHHKLKSPLEKFFSGSIIARNVFIMMRFQRTKEQGEIRKVITDVLQENGLAPQFADLLTLADELWDNVSTYMLGCRFGIAVFEQIEERSFNPNVALELGFMQALQRKVLVLKDRRIPRLPADLCGRIYREFDSYNIAQTLSPQINAWLEELRTLGELQK